MGERKDAYRVLVGRPEERDHLEDLGADGRMILIWIFKTWEGEMDWIELAQDKDRCWALVNLRVP